MRRTDLLGDVASCALRLEDELVGTIRQTTDEGLELGWRIRRDSAVFQIRTTPAAEPEVLYPIRISPALEGYPGEFQFTEAQVDSILEAVAEEHRPWENEVSRLTAPVEGRQPTFDGLVVTGRLVASDAGFGPERYHRATKSVVDEGERIGRTLFGQLDALVDGDGPDPDHEERNASPAFN